MALSEKTITNTYKILTAIGTIGFVLYLSVLFFDIIVLLIISIFIAMMFNPLVSILENKGVSRFTAVLIVFLVSGTVIFLGLSVLIPKILSQMDTLSATLNQDKINSLLKQIESELKAYIPFLDSKDFATKLEEFFSGLFFNSINNITDIVTSIVTIIALSVIIPFMTFFLLKDNARIVKGIINIVPNRYFEFSYSVLHEIGFQLGRFVRGWILDAFVVGFLAAVGLAILGMQNAITIGFVAGIGHLIPYFGPIIGGIPAIIISLIQFGDFSMLPQIVLMFVIIYTVDNGYIQPNIFSKSTDMHPLLIILLILAGSQVLGILGMLLAVPTATVIKTAAREIYYGYKNYKIIRV